MWEKDRKDIQHKRRISSSRCGRCLPSIAWGQSTFRSHFPPLLFSFLLLNYHKQNYCVWLSINSGR
jgi:hypothetical protein